MYRIRLTALAGLASLVLIGGCGLCCPHRPCCGCCSPCSASCPIEGSPCSGPMLGEGPFQTIPSPVPPMPGMPPPPQASLPPLTPTPANPVPQQLVPNAQPSPAGPVSRLR